MARCDEGYDCEVCGKPVEAITESGLYLRYVLGDVPLDMLHKHPERHLACDPSLAQYIVDDRFTPVHCPGPFDKREMHPHFVDAEEARVTAGWQRLQAIPTLGLSLPEYPITLTPTEESP